MAEDGPREPMPRWREPDRSFGRPELSRSEAGEREGTPWLPGLIAVVAFLVVCSLLYRLGA